MDDNDREDKPDETPAPPLSAEFLSGGTAADLEKIRARTTCRIDRTNPWAWLRSTSSRGS